MLQRALFLAVFFYSACVTVNIYFPAAAVERAADQIVKETWGGAPPSDKPAPAPQSRGATPQTWLRLSLAAVAHAQEADINISNPAIRALKDSIKRRSQAIKPYMERGSIGISRDGLLALRNTEGLSLKERAEAQQLIDAENRDREALYAEIAKANNFDRDSIPKIKAIFARSWIDQAQPGWWVQDGQGWRKK